LPVRRLNGQVRHCFFNSLLIQIWPGCVN